MQLVCLIFVHQFNNEMPLQFVFQKKTEKEKEKSC